MTHVRETRMRNSRENLVRVSYRLAARYFSHQIERVLFRASFSCEFSVRFSGASVMGFRPEALGINYTVPMIRQCSFVQGYFLHICKELQQNKCCNKTKLNSHSFYCSIYSILLNMKPLLKLRNFIRCYFNSINSNERAAVHVSEAKLNWIRFSRSVVDDHSSRKVHNI